ncbi:MAG: hypothetical protein ABW167_05165 [Baekduia sp.]
MSARKAGERWICECGAALIGALSVNMKVSPITVEPKQDGNVWLGRSKTRFARQEDGTYVAATSDRTPGDFVTVYAVIGGPGLELLREKNVGLHLNHFADCPMAGRFR